MLYDSVYYSLSSIDIIRDASKLLVYYFGYAISKSIV
jgi:hypothetical protein